MIDPAGLLLVIMVLVGFVIGSTDDVELADA
jgi:hypothetical protein